jgi:SAM-dependent methyltransferase
MIVEGFAPAHIHLDIVNIEMKRIIFRVLLRVARLLGINQLQDLLRVQHEKTVYLESRLIDIETTIDKQIAAVYRLSESNFLKRLTEVQDAILKASAMRIEEVQDAILKASITHSEEFLGNEIAGIRRSIDNYRRVNSPTHTPNAVDSVPNSSVLESVIDDAMYVNLEDHFRGDPELVTERQSAYVSVVKEAVTKEFPLIDLGCGRGEWLQILKNADIYAIGVDGNRVCVRECEENGLEVKQGDLIEFLRLSEDNSLGAITMFQVLEHLTFSAVVEVLREARRVLISGGVFIGEVPNSETLRVGASTFWIDPTHQRPLFPELLRFIATEVGFSKVDSHYASPLENVPTFEGLPSNIIDSLQRMHQQINGPGDFAIIATA